VFYLEIYIDLTSNVLLYLRPVPFELLLYVFFHLGTDWEVDTNLFNFVGAMYLVRLEAGLCITGLHIYSESDESELLPSSCGV
jgi:hypothetical protein